MPILRTRTQQVSYRVYKRLSTVKNLNIVGSLPLFNEMDVVVVGSSRFSPILLEVYRSLSRFGFGFSIYENKLES